MASQRRSISCIPANIATSLVYKSQILMEKEAGYISRFSAAGQTHWVHGRYQQIKTYGAIASMSNH